ncbi:YlmC/YmxH family sporulation protein [Paratissierella segnis]|jgi:YlmC/YmxH family sporulation protein|uniref:YlmC/YmxH family sporulation protein n=1 Tax=Paratissierella segnis TaxID=2763679 RepID=A0A926EXU6_9FIRM|nr:YlmC/YmxH family sporulation protein [Paratissierella segnis]MBC8588487.1 YlmC/YmxH family sporulation protein [Paratissierella segnis]
MIKLTEIKEKEVINLHNGQRLGYVYDFEVDLEKGCLSGIILPSGGKISFFSKTNDILIEWNQIIKIGVDTILVDIKDD